MKGKRVMNRKVTITGALAFFLGSALWGWGATRDIKQAAFAYLFAFAAVLTTVIGMLFLLMVGHGCGAKWFVPLRRQCEVVVGAMPLACVFWLPLLSFLPELYPWMRVAELPAEMAHHVDQKRAWLGEDFFIGRSLGYLLVFVSFAELLRHLSVLQDEEATEQRSVKLRRTMVKTSITGLVVLSFVLTFASWDWLMSLEPVWFSDMYGVYVFAGAFVAALGLLGALSVLGHFQHTLPEQVAANHFHAIGRLQFAMVIFWAYIGYAHVIQHWIANVPLEQHWYLRRWSGGWQWFGLGLLILHWFVPFLVLLSRAVKRNARSFLTVSVYLVLVHLLDVYYLVLPAGYEAHLVWSWMSGAALFALAGATVSFAAWRSHGRASIAFRDPLFRIGLNYESQS